MRRSISIFTAIGWLTSSASGAQPEVTDNGDTVLQELHDLLSATPGTPEPSIGNSTAASLRDIGTTFPKIQEIHVPKVALQSSITLSVVNAEPVALAIHDSKGALFIPRPTSVLHAGMQAMGMMEPGSGPITTQTTTSVAAAGFIGGPTTTPTTTNLTTIKQPLPSPELHNSIAGDVPSGGPRVQPGLQALGLGTDGPTSTSTSTSVKILMSAFVFSGTTYPPLLMGTHFSVEKHSSQSVLNPDWAGTVEQHVSQTALALSTPQPSAKPAVTTPAEVPQTSIPAQISQTTTTVRALETTTPAEASQTTTPLVAGAAANGILISAFTFQGTAYPAVPIVPENSAAAALDTTPNPETTQSEAQPSEAEAAGAQPLSTKTPQAAHPTSTAIPAQQGGFGIAQLPGFSVSGIALPTTFDDPSGPRSTTPTPSSIPPAAGAAVSTFLYLSENPAGVPLIGATTIPTYPLDLATPSPFLSPLPQNPNPNPASPSPSPTTLPFVGIPIPAGVAQSFLTSGLPYALTTDASGFVSYRPLATGTGGGGLWGNGTGPGRGGNSTGGIVPFLSGAGRGRGNGWEEWWWGWLGVGLGLGVGVMGLL